MLAWDSFLTAIIPVRIQINHAGRLSWNLTRSDLSAAVIRSPAVHHWACLYTFTVCFKNPCDISTRPWEAGKSRLVSQFDL